MSNIFIYVVYFEFLIFTYIFVDYDEQNKIRWESIILILKFLSGLTYEHFGKPIFKQVILYLYLVRKFNSILFYYVNINYKYKYKLID